MRRMVNKKNQELNITDPRLPYFTDSEKNMVKGAWSFLKSSIAIVETKFNVLVFLSFGSSSSRTIYLLYM